MKQIQMKKDSVVLGSSTKSDIIIEDVKVSRNHCRIEMTPQQVPVCIFLSCYVDNIIRFCYDVDANHEGRTKGPVPEGVPTYLCNHNGKETFKYLLIWL
jgi:hypothetical protein